MDHRSPLPIASTVAGLLRRRGVSSWLISACVHLAIVIGLGLMVLPAGTRAIQSILLSAGMDAAEPPPLVQLDRSSPELPQPSPSEAQLAVNDPLAAMSVIQPDQPQPAADNASSLTSAALDTKIPSAGEQPSDAMFFGTSASGRDFVFILDISGSMVARKGQRYIRARDELVHSVSKLRSDQRFYVFLFNWSTIPMFGPLEAPAGLIPATGDNISRLRAWLYSIQPHSGTDPRMSLRGAYALQPDAIFLLSDGNFNTPPRNDPALGWDASLMSVFDVVGHPDAPPIQINTIAFEDPTPATGMARLAEMTEGQFRFVPVPGQENHFEEIVSEPVGPEYEPATRADRMQMSEDVQLVRRAEKLLSRNRARDAFKLVRELDPLRLPRKVRGRLQRILQAGQYLNEG